MSVGAQQISEQVGIAGVTLGVHGGVARAAGLDDVGMDGHEREAGLDEGVDEQAAGALDGDRQLVGLAIAAQPAYEFGQPRTVMRDLETILHQAVGVDDAHGVQVPRPVQSYGMAHRSPPSGRLPGAGRSGRSLTDGRSGCSTAAHQTDSLARLPVVGRDLPAPSWQRVSYGLSSSERDGLSTMRHREHRTTLERNRPTGPRVDQ